MTDLQIIYTTCANEDEAAKIARTLVEERLAACGNIFPGVRSIFRWQGEIQEEGEAALIIKTRNGRLDAAIARIEALHSYDEPGIEVWPVTRVNEVFANWVREQTS